jgi:hypothetical protein
MVSNACPFQVFGKIDGIQIIVVVLGWRVFRVLHGVCSAAHQEHEKELQKLYQGQYDNLQHEKNLMKMLLNSVGDVYKKGSSVYEYATELTLKAVNSPELINIAEANYLDLFEAIADFSGELTTLALDLDRVDVKCAALVNNGKARKTTVKSFKDVKVGDRAERPTDAPYPASSPNQSRRLQVQRPLLMERSKAALAAARNATPEVPEFAQTLGQFPAFKTRQTKIDSGCGGSRDAGAGAAGAGPPLQHPASPSSPQQTGAATDSTTSTAAGGQRPASPRKVAPEPGPATAL